MGTKAYPMVNTEKKLNEAEHHVDPVSELEVMPEVESIEPAAPTPFLDEISSTPGGETIRWCIQCGTCSASCPNVAQMDYSPRKIIAMIRAGRRNDVLTSNTMWICASCYMCTVRCPRDVRITELMHTLERVATRHGLTLGRTPAAMHRVFIDSIKSNGRVHELGMMLKFYLSTIPTGKINPLATIKMLPLALKLLTHGRMALKPTKIKGSEQLKTIVEKARALGGAR
jgi:heterodisulfide reductase subunit C